MPRQHRTRDLSSTVLFWLSAVTLVFAMLFGGGQGWIGEQLLGILGVTLAVLAGLRVARSNTHPERTKWFWALPLALVALPLLQLVPLPAFIWSHLQGRESAVAGLAAAGINVGWRPWTHSSNATERVLWSLMVPIGLFMAASVLRGEQRRRLVSLVLGLAALSVLVGLWQVMEGAESALYFYETTNRGSAVGFFANRNHLAGFLAALVPVAAGVLADRVRHERHPSRDLRVWLLTASIVLLAVGVTVTQSRAGFMLLMASAVGAAAVLYSARAAGESNAQPWLRVSAALAIVLVVQYTLYALLVRLQSDPLDDYRWTLTPRTIEAAAPAMGTGFGFGTFRHAYDDIGDVSADMPAYVNHAHNDYAELWLEGGLPAVLLAALALLLIVRAVIRQLRPRDVDDPFAQRSHHRGLKTGAAFALLFLAAHSFVDYPLRTLTAASVAALMAAVLLGSVRRHQHSPVTEDAVPEGWGDTDATPVEPASA